MTNRKYHWAIGYTILFYKDGELIGKSQPLISRLTANEKLRLADEHGADEITVCKSGHSNNVHRSSFSSHTKVLTYRRLSGKFRLVKTRQISR